MSWCKYFLRTIKDTPKQPSVVSLKFKGSQASFVYIDGPASLNGRLWKGHPQDREEARQRAPLSPLWLPQEGRNEAATVWLIPSWRKLVGPKEAPSDSIPDPTRKGRDSLGHHGAHSCPWHMCKHWADTLTSVGTGRVPVLSGQWLHKDS